jgi:hypothetical protein
MSRSNPSLNNNPHPCSRWFEYNAQKGVVQYYDKEAKANKEVGKVLNFILLDQLAGIAGWHEASKSSITSNEVRSSQNDTLTVKSFKGGELAKGLYADIKATVKLAGGKFTGKLYIAYKGDDGKLALGCLQLHGAALGAWMEFEKTNRKEIYKQSIQLFDVLPAKKGTVNYFDPMFKLVPLSPESETQAVELDKTLQGYLEVSLKRNLTAQPPAATEEEAPVITETFTADASNTGDPTDMPF